jgi:hypothetical protein
MVDIIAQASFNSGEWAPNLYARVDLQKYKAGAALLENFYIDYRGGASTRAGTKYILQAFKSATPVRLIPFQASFAVGYILEFGQNYIRFYFQGSPILESSFAISGASQANPAVLTISGNNYAVGDWIFIESIVGMTQLNGRYFSVLAVSGSAVTLGDLNGNNLDSSGYTAYVSGGTAQRVYTITTPYAAADLAILKFAQATNEMVLCHPNYVPFLLSIVTATNWTLAPVVIGSTAAAPTGIAVSTTLSAGSVNYSYAVTSIDAAGQESPPSAVGALANIQDIRTVAGSNSITWTAAPGAVAYNVYESDVSYFGVVPTGASYGFIGTTKGVVFVDTNIGPDFSQSPPIEQDPFIGGQITSVAVTAPGTYTTIPTISTSGGSPSSAASLAAVMQTQGTPTVASSGVGFFVGERFTGSNGLVVQALTVDGSGRVGTVSVVNPGSISTGFLPSSVQCFGVGGWIFVNVVWGVGQVVINNPGAGFSSAPTIVFSSGSAAATATIATLTGLSPTVPSFFQQRLVLAAPTNAPQTFYMSKPGLYFNFDTSNPIEASDAITETLVSGVLNTIKSIVSSTSGMLLLTDKAIWLVNGGTSGSAVSPISIVANVQSWIGASDVPPIQANYDVLYVQSKGSGVRDLAYNIYFNVFTGSDISITSSHLFFGFNITQWAWAESPYYVVWAVRNDGVMLTLTYLKEQEFVGWTHQITNGAFKSVATVTEATSDAGNVDAVYTVVQRTINGNVVQYIERVADRVFPNGLSSAWCVDCGIQYSGAAELSFQGGEFLAGVSVTGLATDDLGNVSIITPFTMPVSGFFTLPTPGGGATGYTMVTLGEAFICNLQTLGIDIVKEQIQGKLKRTPDVDVRVNNTLGLSIGEDFDHLVSMKDLIDGNISSMLTGQELQVVDGLYSGDARTIIGPAYTVPGQYCIQQSNPYPATVLGIFTALVTEDSP